MQIKAGVQIHTVWVCSFLELNCFSSIFKDHITDINSWHTRISSRPRFQLSTVSHGMKDKTGLWWQSEGKILTGWLMACLLCLTSGLIKEKHHRPCSHKTHWSTAAERVIGEIYHGKLFNSNKTNTGGQNDMRTPGHYSTDCLQTQRGHFIGNFCQEKDGWLLSLQGLQEKTEGQEGNLRLI